MFFYGKKKVKLNYSTMQKNKIYMACMLFATKFKFHRNKQKMSELQLQINHYRDIQIRYIKYSAIYTDTVDTLVINTSKCCILIQYVHVIKHMLNIIHVRL